MRSSKRVTTLMGDKVAPRREWIESHVGHARRSEYIR